MPTPTKPPLSWKAQKQPDGVYCAPACGRKCTQAEHDLALKRAKALVAKLGADKWKPRVWENLGWHYAAQSKCDRMSVSEYWPSRNRSDAVSKLGALVPDHYTCFMNEAGQLPGGRWVGEGKTPQEAVADAVAQARDERDRLLAVLDGILDGLDGLE